MTTCRACKQPVIWVETVASAKRAGHRLPLDADPDKPARPLVVEGGNVVIVRGRTGDGTPLARYVKAGKYRSHFGTCPMKANNRGVRGRSTASEVI